MAEQRTITIVRQPLKAGQDEASPQAWIVRVDGHEFTHGHRYAMEFDLAEDAARFATDLKLEYGLDTDVEVVGLDALGVPLYEEPEAPAEPNSFDAWLVAYDLPEPQMLHPRDQQLAQITRALFLEWPAARRIELILGLYRHDLSAQRVQELRSYEPAFAIARLKQMLPATFVDYAALQAAFRTWQHQQEVIKSHTDSPEE